MTSSTQDELAKSVGSIMALEVLEVSTCWCFDAWHTCTQTVSTRTDGLIIKTLDFHGQILDGLFVILMLCLFFVIVHTLFFFFFGHLRIHSRTDFLSLILMLTFARC